MTGEIIDRTEAIRFLSELVRIPSVNPQMGGGAGEGEIAGYLADRLKCLGLGPTVTEVKPGRPNVLATVPGKQGGVHLLFQAHTDTVPPSHGQAGPFTPRLEGDRLYGRGACDTKGSIAALLLALASVLAVRERDATVSVAFAMGEELGHEGAAHLVSSGFRPDAAEGGLQVNVVPDRCTIELDRRLVPGETWADVRRELEAVLVPLRAEDPDLQATIQEPYQNTPCMETPLDAAIVRIAKEAVCRIDGRHPARGVPFATDAALLSAAGVPCIVLGPGHIAEAHTSTEYVEIQQVMKAAAIYREIMLSS